MEIKYGKVEIESQSFLNEAEKNFDILNIRRAVGIKREIWFDVTDFYGKE